MNILALDASTEVCSVALCIGNNVYDRFQTGGPRQSELLLPMIQSLLNEAQIDFSALTAIAFCQGPGSFTGLRMATGLVQGLSFATGLPVLPISTLQVVAQGAYMEYEESRVLVAMDARMGQVYWGAYELSDNNLMALARSDELSNPETLDVDAFHGWYGVGTGWDIYANEFKAIIPSLKGCKKLFPHSRYMLPLARNLMAKGEWVNVDSVRPVYLRDEVVN